MTRIILAALLAVAACAQQTTVYNPFTRKLDFQALPTAGTGIAVSGTAVSINDAVVATHASIQRGEAIAVGTTGGTADAFTGGTTQALQGVDLTDGKTIIVVRFHTAANASATLNVDSTGALPLRDTDGTAAGTGDFPSGICLLGYESASSGGWRKIVCATASALSYTSITAAGSSTWTVPAGVTSIQVFLCGGGGGGQGANTAGSNGGHGGGGGGCEIERLQVTGGATYNYTVGAAGTGNAGGGVVAGSGGDSTFGPVGGYTLTARGGVGGGTAGAGGVGGYGMSPKGNATARRDIGGAGGSGGSGASGAAAGSGACGGGGGGGYSNGGAVTGGAAGSSLWQFAGSGGAGGASDGTADGTTVGATATGNCGGGGGGGGLVTGSIARAGGNGAPGIIVITY